MCDCKESIIKNVKVVLKAGNLNFRNGITLTGTNAELGGTLLQDTDITGVFKLNLGTTTNRLTQINLKASSKVSLDYAGTALINLDSTGIVIIDTVQNRGLVGVADFRAQYTNLTYIQKIYADNKIASKDLSSILTTPTITQDGYSIKWDNTAGKFTLGANNIAPGSTKQVIFNDGGIFGANTNFTYDKTTGELQAGYLLTLKDFNATGATNITVAGTGNVSLGLNPLGTADINLNVNGGVIGLGSSFGSTSIKLVVKGSIGILDLILAPKGVTGIVYVGDFASAGSTRTIQAIGTASNIDLVLLPKGSANVSIGGVKLINVANGSSTNDAVNFGQLSAISTSITSKANKAQASWVAVSLIAGWIAHSGSYSLPYYRVNEFNRMEVKGVVKSAGGTGAMASIFSGGWMINSVNEITKVPVVIDRGGVSIASYLEIQPNGATALTEATVAGDVVTCNCDFALD